MAQEGIWNACYVRAPLQLLSVLWGLGLLGQRVCFGEVHLQDVPPYMPHPLFLDGEWALEFHFTEPALEGINVAHKLDQ